MAKYYLEIMVKDELGNKVDSVVSEVVWLRPDDARGWMKALYLMMNNMITGKMIRAEKPVKAKPNLLRRWFGRP